MAIKSLTFDHESDKLFTIAIDEKGRRYRILCAAGGPPGAIAHYHLKPHTATGDGIATHRGVWITANHALLPAIEAAEKIRRERVSTPESIKAAMRLTVEEI